MANDLSAQCYKSAMNLDNRIALTPLAAADIVILDGVDASAFANAQFTNNVLELARGRWQWNAWLDAQGRVRHFFALLKIAEDRLIAWQPLGDATLMRDALARFVFRAKVTLNAEPNWSFGRVDSLNQAAAVEADQVIDRAGRLIFAQPGSSPRLAYLTRNDDIRFDRAGLDQWRRADIEARLPLIPTQASSLFVPQALELDRIDAIRFDKGCYPGQEIAARLHFRGGNKRFLRKIDVDHAAATAGTASVQQGDDGVGRVLYAVERADGRADALAVVSAGAGTPSAA